MTRTIVSMLLLTILAAGSAAQDPSPLPEVRLTMADADLWDPDTGIYVNPRERGRKWEREAAFEFVTAGSAELVSTIVGVRIHGGRSRGLDQKSLRIYFDHGDGPVKLDLFGGEPTHLARIILRSIQSPDRTLHTNLAETLFRDLGHLGSRQAPVTATLNGEDWGIYSARERLEDEWVTVTLGYEGEFALIRDGEIEHGDGDHWWQFLATFAEPADRTSPAWLAAMERQLDLASYIDWLVILAFGAAADNGDAHNLALLRLGEEPWRVIMWDADDLFRDENLQNDHWRWFAAADEDEYEQFRPPLLITGNWETRGPWAALFRGLLENPGFRERFFERAEELLAGELSAARLADRLDALVAAHEPGLTRHAARWNWASSRDLHDHATAMKEWIAARHVIVQDQLEAMRARHGERGEP